MKKPLPLTVKIKPVIIALLVILLFTVSLSCTGDNGSSGSEDIVTNFERMLAQVPYSFLENYDIWFSSPGTLKTLYDLEELDSLASLMALPADERQAAMQALFTIPYPHWNASGSDMASVVGWDWLMIGNTIFCETPPPRGFVLAEGNFDETAIVEKLTGHGYASSTYKNYTYYHLNEDMETNMTGELGRMFMAQINRVGFPANFLVTAPDTPAFLALLDTISGDNNNLLDNPSAAAIAAGLGEPLGAVIITPEKIITHNPDQIGNVTPFSIPAAQNWGILHDYALAGFGYRDDGQNRYWDICLYYTDKSEAEADAAELVSRLESYVFMTQYPGSIPYPLTDVWEVDEPVIHEYSEGVTLTVSNHYLPETTGSHSLFSSIIETRDTLFLVPDPTPFLNNP